MVLAHKILLIKLKIPDDVPTFTNALLPFQLLTEAGSVFNGSPVMGVFLVDPTVGTDTCMTVSYSEKVNVTVTSPQGLDMTRDTHPEHFHFDEESGVIKIALPGTAKVS